MDSPRNRGSRSNSTQACRTAYRSAEGRDTTASLVGVVGGLVSTEIPDDPHQRAPAGRGRNQELTAGHFRPLPQIADAGAMQPRRIARFVGHPDAVVAHLETQHRAVALEFDAHRLRPRML